MPGCKVDDVARFIAPTPSPLLGRFVTVVREVTPPECFVSQFKGPWFEVRYCGWQFRNGVDGRADGGNVPDDILQPLRGDGPPTAGDAISRRDVPAGVVE